jgi:murein DD-endopeptidase MepM/ murein hydrolase activator NlpD
MRSWTGRKVLRFLRLALPVTAAAVLAPLALTSWIETLPARTPDGDAAPPAVAQAASMAPSGLSLRPALAASATTVANSEARGEGEPDRVHTLRSGDTLGAALRDLGLPPAQAERAAEAASRYVNPRQLRPGLRIAAYLDGTVPAKFALALSGQGELSVERGGEEWLPSWRPYRRESRTRTLHGVLEGSLEESVTAAGADPALAYAMADVLQWDLDFNRDLKRGDRFDVRFEEVYVEGRYFDLERILALSYGQSGHRLEVFQYGSAGTYYDAEGRPAEKMFLRAPLPYSRVTSKFSKHRFHPVLKVVRPHYGVDYGAPVGTPVRVTAAGTVISAGWEGGGGKTIKVRHPNGYVTGYLHLSGYAKGIRAGVRVRQGDLIGYVGKTGLASGPHLDYRVQRDGSWIDPQSLKSVPSPPLDAAQLSDFRVVRDALRAELSLPAQLDPGANGTQLALAALPEPRLASPGATAASRAESMPSLKTNSATRK